MSKKLTADDTVLGLAASVTSRACDLITDGWVKGSMMKKEGGAPVSFCIHGAIDLAMEEVFTVKNLKIGVQRDVEDIAVAFICDEAFGEMRKGTIPGAMFNDAAARKHEEVTGVLNRASERLWDLAVGADMDAEHQEFTYSKWADVDEETAKAYLNASLN